MPFAYAIQQMTVAGMAARRPNMAGYAKRTAGATEGAWNLVWVKRDGTETTYAVAANGTITCATPMTFDVELMRGMMSADWTVGQATDFEAARSGTGNIW